MKYIFAVSLITIIFSNCTIERRLYSPTQVNNPSIQASNDYSLSLTYSAPSGFDLNGGYALTNRLAIIGGLYKYKNNDQEEESSLFSGIRQTSLLIYKHKGFHIGTGIYFPISADKASTFLSFFGGYTKGNFEMREKLYETYPNPSASPRLNFYKSDLNRWFAQGSINLYNQHIQQSFIIRFNYAGYSNVETDYNSSQQNSFKLPPTAYSKWSSFLDFSFDTRIFFSKDQRLGMQLFGTTTTRLNRKDFDFYIYPTRLGIGLILKSPFAKPGSAE